MERLILCPCGHYLESHDDRRCTERRTCPCRRSHGMVVEAAIESEREAARRFWLNARPTTN